MKFSTEEGKKKSKAKAWWGEVTHGKLQATGWVTHPNHLGELCSSALIFEKGGQRRVFWGRADHEKVLHVWGWGEDGIREEASSSGRGVRGRPGLTHSP